MLCSRRYVVETLVGTVGTIVLWQDQPPMPRPRVRTPVNPPEPAEKQDADAPPGLSRKVSLEAQERELRETMNQLYGKVQDLKVQLDGMRTSEVFSVVVFKQTQEIEKLAKRLKSCARG